MTKQTPPVELVTVRVADEVRAELARQRKTAAGLASTVGITAHTMGVRLKGAVPFNVAELMIIATELGMTLVELISRAEQAEKKTAA